LAAGDAPASLADDERELDLVVQLLRELTIQTNVLFVADLVLFGLAKRLRVLGIHGLLAARSVALLDVRFVVRPIHTTFF